MFKYLFNYEQSNIFSFLPFDEVIYIIETLLDSNITIIQRNNILKSFSLYLSSYNEYLDYEEIHLPLFNTFTKLRNYIKKLSNVPTLHNLPKNLTHLEFDLDFDEEISPGDLPQTLIEIRFGESFNQPILPNVFPSSLKILSFGDYFNHFLSPNVLPEGLTELYLSKEFCCTILPNVLPSSLQILQLKGFNLPISPNVLPKNLKKLYFGDFNQPILPNVLPNSLQVLSFGTRFNQPIPNNVLPHSLINIRFPFKNIALNLLTNEDKERFIDKFDFYFENRNLNIF